MNPPVTLTIETGRVADVAGAGPGVLEMETGRFGSILSRFMASDAALSLEVFRGIKILESLGLGSSLGLSRLIFFPLTSGCASGGAGSWAEGGGDRTDCWESLFW